MIWHAVFTYFPFVVWVLTYLTFVRPLRLRVRDQSRWMAVLLLCFSKFLCFRGFGGNAFTPELPEVVIWAWDWAYSGAMILFALSVVLFLFRFPRKAYVVPVAAWGLAAWGLWNGVCVPKTVEIELAFENLPPALDGYRIAHLSDLHCSSAARRWRTQAIVDIVHASRPDLICITGDNVDGTLAKRRDFLEPILRLRARDGVLACTGNHEYYFNFPEWMDGFYRSSGAIRILDNACAFPRPGLAVAGVPDPAGRQKGLDAPPDVRTAFAAATNGEFRVLLQHQPKSARENVREVGVNLQLSGHVHGGIAPGFRQFIERFNGGFSRGVYAIGKSYLHVSPGCGQWAGFPMRFFNDSEVTLITLRR